MGRTNKRTKLFMTSERVIEAIAAFRPKKRFAWRSQQITGGKRTCQCTLRRLRIVRCEFGPSSCRRLAQRLRGMLAGGRFKKVFFRAPQHKQAAGGVVVLVAVIA